MASVLIVDDDADLRHSIEEVLQDEGYHVRTARDGREALLALREAPRREALPDLILLDLMMPEMNGWEFREAQLADDVIASVPVVALTAAVYLGRPLSVDHVLQKPVRVERLLSVVARYARRDAGATHC